MPFEGNRELLIKVRDAIDRNPHHFDMRTYFAVNGEDISVRVVRQVLLPDMSLCGTTACIAGWACVLARSAPDYNTSDHARELLDITDAQSLSLFYESYWPPQFRNVGFTNSERAVARINHMLETGE